MNRRVLCGREVGKYSKRSTEKKVSLALQNIVIATHPHTFSSHNFPSLTPGTFQSGAAVNLKKYSKRNRTGKPYWTQWLTFKRTNS